VARSQRYRVMRIDPINYGHQRRVELMDTSTGDLTTLTYGDGVSDAFIYVMAPLLAAKKTKRRGTDEKEF
jgi:hypothetical protein